MIAQADGPPPSAVNPVVRAALYLYVASIPFEMPQRSLPLEVPTLTGFVFLVVTLLQPSVVYRRIPGALLAFAAFLFAGLASAVVNDVQHGPPDLLKFIVDLAQVALLLWAIVNLLGDARTLRGVLLSFAAACTLRAAIQVLGIAVNRLPVYDSYTASTPSGYRLTTFGQNPNLSAMILAAGIVTLVGLRRSRSLPLRILVWPIAALIALAIIQGGSRGGLLCVLVGLAVFAFEGTDAQRRLRHAVVALLAVACLGWGALHSSMMRERLTQSESGDLSGRGDIYALLWDMTREHPFFGWGLVGNQFELGRRLNDPRYVSRDAHNLLLDLVTSAGVIGATPFLFGLGLCIRGAWRARAGPLGVVPLAMLAAVLTGTLSGTWIASKILWLALAVALAAGAYWTAPILGSEGLTA